MNVRRASAFNGEETMDQATSETPATDAADDGWEWAIVEIFGHRSHAGRTREEERFGTKMLRVDVPVDGDPAAKGWKTFYYGGASIFSFALATEAAVMKANRPYVSPYRLAAPLDDEPAGDEQDEGSQE